MMAKHKTPQEVFELCAKIHNNFYDYSKSVYLGAKTKMEIICPKKGHGSFWQQPYDHYQGIGCKKCGDERKGGRLSKEEQVKAFNLLFNNKYDYSESVIINNGTKIKIICNVDGHEPFWLTPNCHKEGNGCGECKRELKLKGIWPGLLKKANEIHNNFYDYSQFVYKGNAVKSIIICTKENHGPFQKKFKHHLKGKSCPKCALEKKTREQYSNKEEFVEKAEKLYPGKYTFEKFIYTSATDYGIMTCKKHGDFEQIPNRFFNGMECREFTKISFSEKKSVGVKAFVERSNEKHKNKYSYDKVIEWKGVGTKVEIFCPTSDHGYFLQTPHAHMRGLGCPKCTHIISDGCIEWLDSLGIPNDNLHREVLIRLEPNRRKIKADGYMPETNTIYEYNGDYWHGNPNNPKFPHDVVQPKTKKTYGELYQNTLIRDARIKAAGFNLITIWESDWFATQSLQTDLPEHSLQH
jgi:hypothetical protein